MSCLSYKLMLAFHLSTHWFYIVIIFIVVQITDDVNQATSILTSQYHTLPANTIFLFSGKLTYPCSLSINSMGKRTNVFTKQRLTPRPIKCNELCAWSSTFMVTCTRIKDLERLLAISKTMVVVVVSLVLHVKVTFLQLHFVWRFHQKFRFCIYFVSNCKIDYQIWGRFH